MSGEDELVIDLNVSDRAFNEVREFGTQLYAMRTQTVWFQNVLVCLLDAILREYENLRAGMDKSTLLVAWACRNMLELIIFTKYTLAKGSNAKDFVDDMWIDAVDIFSSFREFIRFHDPARQAARLEQTIDNLKSQKAKHGIVRGYLKVSEMAVAVDFAEEYRRMHKATSKLVHPTAFSVLGKADEEALGNELKQIFFLAAVRYGLDAFNEMKDYVAKQGVEPLP
jgi:hypothetical protein